MNDQFRPGFSSPNQDPASVSFETKVERAFQQFLDQRFENHDLSAEEFLRNQPVDLRPELQDRIHRFFFLRRFLEGRSGLATGKVVADFTLIRPLGRGGAAEVWEAQQNSLERRVALKFLHQSTCSTSWRRLQNEAKAIARLAHPNLVTLYSTHRVENYDFLALELIEDGRNLSDLLEEVRHAPEFPEQYFLKLARTFFQVAQALQHAHDHGLIHRDVKPANILLDSTQDIPKLSDFGLVKEIAGESLTVSGKVVGTPHYLSPEQCRTQRQEIDLRTDLFSFGATLYEALTLNRAFPGETREQVIDKILHQDPPHPCKVHALVPRDLAVICLKALEKNSDNRYSSMKLLAEDLERFLSHEPIHAKAPGWATRTRKWARRHPTQATVVVLGILWITMISSFFIREYELNRRLRGTLAVSYVPALQELEEDAKRLFPPFPENIQAYESWLRRWQEIDGKQADINYTISWLQARGRKLSETELETYRSSRPGYNLLQWQRLKLKNLEDRLAAIELKSIETTKNNEPFSFDLSRFSQDPNRLANAAWKRVFNSRDYYGEEKLGLAIIDHALELTDPKQDAWLLAVRAVALLANHQFDAALAAMEDVIKIAPRRELEAYQSLSNSISREIRRHQSKQGILEIKKGIDDLRQSVETLERQLGPEVSWKFQDPLHERWHQMVNTLQNNLEKYRHPQSGWIDGYSDDFGPGIRLRLQMARSIHQRSISGGDAPTLWREAIESIQDREECPQYEGLQIKPQLGLLPLGQNSKTGLWEFIHLLSGEIPNFDSRRKDWVLTKESGIVFILLPGNSFFMGAQSEDPSGRNYDPLALSNEGPVSLVSVEPFFISKYELTQAQWHRFTGQEPSRNYFKVLFGVEVTGDLIPVETITWKRANTVLRWYGLNLPTDKQWEYAARAGSNSPWFTGNLTLGLDAFGNLADRARIEALRNPDNLVEDGLEDGRPSLSPVGKFRPNDFGLYDTLGNVGEWCDTSLGSDMNEDFTPHYRGGSYVQLAKDARFSNRSSTKPFQKSQTVGIRPALELQK